MNASTGLGDWDRSAAKGRGGVARLPPYISSSTNGTCVLPLGIM